MKLLNKTLRLYIVYAALILLIAVPVFYFAIKNIVIEDVDESMMAQKSALIKKLEMQTNGAQLYPEINSTDFELKLLASYSKFDTFFITYKYDSISKEILPYRTMKTNVLIQTKPYSMTLRSSLIDTEDLIERICLITGLLSLLIIVGLFFITRYISRKVWHPFYSTLNLLHTFRVDKDETLQLPNTEISEFSDLNQTITKLATTNMAVFKSQKEFTENASHEMQTPLAVFQSKVELLMQTNPLTSEQAALITEAEQAVQRMNKLNKTLLLLAKIDNNQFSETETIVLEALIRQLLAQYAGAIAEKNIAVDSAEMDNSSITVNRYLLEVLIGNLLTNSIRYNINSGSIKISITNKRLFVSNTGLQTPLDTSKLFHRFQKQNTSNSSSGLGLALVKQICELYNATVNYDFKEGNHIFSVDFNSSATQ
jgi:signal transduction histidine kinase